MRVIGLAGWSGAGKTTLVLRLIPWLGARGLSVSTLKHAHHDFDVDQPGKDSYEHRRAGAREVLVASERRYALMHELRGTSEPGLGALLGKLSPVDLVLVEGFKRSPLPKIEIHQKRSGKPFLYPDDPRILALAADSRPERLALPYRPLDDIAGIAGLVQDLAEPIEGVIARLDAKEPS